MVIVVVIDSSDPKTGAETLAKAKDAAPHAVEDVGVRIVGGGGVYYLAPVIYSEIAEPVEDTKVRGIVRIVATMNPPVAWFSLHIDDSYLTTVRRTPQVFGAETCVLWNSRTVPNGPHQISLKAYDEQDLEIPFGASDVRVLVAN